MVKICIHGGHGGSEANPGNTWRKVGGIHPGWVHIHIHTLITLRGNFVWPIRLRVCMDSRRKLENCEETHSDCKYTMKLAYFYCVLNTTKQYIILLLAADAQIYDCLMVLTIMRVALAEYGSGDLQVSQWRPDAQPRLFSLECQSPCRSAEPQRLNHHPPPSLVLQSSTAISPKMHGEQPSLSRSYVLKP